MEVNRREIAAAPAGFPPLPSFLLPARRCAAGAPERLRPEGRGGRRDEGRAVGINPDPTYEILAFNAWECACRLWQTAPYWPAGTVFVLVVDPEMGKARKSVVARAKNE